MASQRPDFKVTTCQQILEKSARLSGKYILHNFFPTILQNMIIQYRPGQANLQFSHCESHTKEKFHDFSVTQILREIIFGESRSSITGVLCNFRGSDFCYFGKFQPSKSAKIQKIRIQTL